jgi:hypothetical protein
MTRIFVGAVLGLALAAPARADVTLNQTTGGMGMGISGSAKPVTHLKGNKLRSDVTIDGV